MQLMRVFLFVVSFACSSLRAYDISPYFSEVEEGAFLLLDLHEEQCIIEYNPQLCETQFSPCATFKIPSALIALDLGILENECTQYMWDGSPQRFAAWEKDHTLESAMQYSVVWYFQKLAEHVGEDMYRRYLAKFEYGNRDISSGLTEFWLGQSLRISPCEQLAFLTKLYRGKLPVAQKAIETLKKVLILEYTPDWTLSGRSGTDFEQKLGWFIGHIFVDQKEFVFVTCMRGGASSGHRAKMVTQQILQDIFMKAENSG